MATAKTLKQLFVDELRDAYSGEKQLTKALPKLAKGATSPDLRAALLEHLEETHGQLGRLEQIFEMLDERVRAKHCAGLAGIIEEGGDVLDADTEPLALDAAIIASAQRAEHYEIAAYGTLVAWADALGRPEVSKLLSETLKEEETADKRLSRLATSTIDEMTTTSK